MSCISSVRSSSPVPSSRLTNIFKARSAKLKKYLMDLSGTSGAILLTSLKQALAANNFLLTNYNEVLQFVQKFKHRVKVDIVMQWLKLESIDNRDRIIATLVIPRNMSSIDSMMVSQSDFRKGSLTPQAPSHIRPPAPVHSRANSVNFNNSLNNSQNIKEEYFLERSMSPNPHPPMPINELLRRHRPASVGGPRVGLEHRRNSPSSVMLGGPYLNLSAIDAHEEKTSQKAKSVYKLNISLQCEYSCASTKNENESVMGDNLSMLMNMSPQKLDFNSSGKVNKPSQIMVKEEITKANSPVKNYQSHEPTNRVSQTAVKGEVNTANCSVRDKQTNDDILLELTHDFQKRQVKYEYIFAMLKTAMKLAQQNNIKSVPREAYEESAACLQPMLGVDLYRRLIEYSLDNQGKVSPETLSQFVDHFKYAPYLVKHFKNSSQQFQQLALFGPRDEGSQEKVYYNLKMLGKRIEEKFMKLGKAYRFFDLDKSGYIELPQFKHGLDLLGMRLPDIEVKNLFDHLDRKQDGIIDFDEFCDILEERRIVKSIKASHDVVSNEPEKQKPMRGSTNYSPFIGIIRPDIAEDPRMVDFRKETHETLGPECVSEEQKQCIVRNPSFRKAPVGSVKKFYTPESSVRDIDLRHGVKSQASECMRDIMANNFQREWQEKAKQRERKRVEEEEKRRTRPKKMFNDATILRNEFIKKIYERVHKDDSEAQWKMSKFSNIGPKVSASRKERFNKSSLNNSLNYSSHRTNDHDGNLNISVL